MLDTAPLTSSSTSPSSARPGLATVVYAASAAFASPSSTAVPRADRRASARIENYLAFRRALVRHWPVAVVRPEIGAEIRFPPRSTRYRGRDLQAS
jgi:hypothetical protein